MFSPLDPLLFVIYFGFRGPRFWRQLVFVLGFFPALMWAMPAQPCGCLVVPFRRCSIGGRGLAYYAAMKSDLKNLASQQEIYFSDNGAYSSNAEELGFVMSNAVEVTVFATADGWAAQAKHAALEDAKSCALYFGEPPVDFELLEGARAGELVCSPY